MPEKLGLKSSKLRLALSDLERESRLTYALNYWTIREEKLSFLDHQYLLEPFETSEQQIVHKKAAQVGVSELLICDAIWFADVTGGTVIYIFPAFAQLSTFVQERVDPPIMNSQYLSYACSLSSIPPKDRLFKAGAQSIGIKRVRNGFVHFRGSTKKHLQAVAADQVTLDELDTIEELLPEAPGWAERRIGHSKYKMQRFSSTPTYEDIGIDARFKRGSQAEWNVKCEHCGLWQYLSWHINVILDDRDPENPDAEMVCARCRKPIDRLGEGQWIHAYPDREVRSYHYSKLFSSRTTMKELARHALDRGPGMQQIFYNYDLGETYQPIGDMVDETAINSAIGDYHMEPNGKFDTMGIDPGLKHHWWGSRLEGGRRKCVALGAALGYEELVNLIKRHKPEVVAIDTGYDPTKCKEIAEQFPRKVHLIEYKQKLAEEVQEPKEHKLRPVDKKPVKYVRINRDDVYDSMIEDFARKDGTVVLPIEVKAMKGGDPSEDFYKQMGGVKRIIEVDQTTRETVVKFVKNPNAHFFDAGCMDMVASNLWKPRRGLKLKAETRGGKRYARD